MNTTAEHAEAPPRQSAIESKLTPAIESKSSTQDRTGDSDAVIAQQTLGEALNHSPRIMQMRGLADRLNAGPRMQRLQATAQLLTDGAHTHTQEQQQQQTVADRLDQGHVTQRSAVADHSGMTNGSASPQPNRTGLPSGLKAGVEALSGISMDAVKVHYNSPRPAQMQALAFAQGTDIHVGPGQEKHLPHEAWHVVQQAQGRVKPTVQWKSGIAVNNDRALEKEADVYGARALSLGSMASSGRPAAGIGPSAPRLQRQVPGLAGNQGLRTFSGSGSSLPVSQLFAVQISMGLELLPSAGGKRRFERPSGQEEKSSRKKPKPMETIRGTTQAPSSSSIGSNFSPGSTSSVAMDIDEPKAALEGLAVERLTVVGRPDSPYVGTMGDHSTAFIVSVSGLQLRFEGKTISECVVALRELYAGLKTLPGWAAIEGLHPLRLGQKASLQAAEADLESLLRILSAMSQGTLAIGLLQEAVAAYLNLRELLPFSTLKINALSQGLAGKGKGEAGQAAILRRLEMDLRQPRRKLTAEEKTDAERAHNRLFDAAGAAILSFAEEPHLIAPGIEEKATENERMLLLLKQHSMSMILNYPKVADACGWQESNSIPLKIRAVLQHRAATDLAWLGLRRTALINQKTAVESDRAIKPSKKETMRLEINAYARNLRALRKRIMAIRFYLASDASSAQGDFMGDIGDSKQSRPAKAKKSSAGKSTLKDAGEADVASPAGATTHAVQIVLRPTGRAGQPAIEDIAFGGRPRSPFGSATMGSHTTAWVVYQEHLRAKLKGKTVPDAVEAMSGQLKPPIAGFFKPENATQAGMYLKAEEAYLISIQAAEQAPSIFSLQRCIADYLQYLNFSGDVTKQRGTAALGRGEAGLIAILKEFEEGADYSPEKLLVAVHGLFEGGHTGRMWDRHNRFIQETFPRAWPHVKTEIAAMDDDAQMNSP